MVELRTNNIDEINGYLKALNDVRSVMNHYIEECSEEDEEQPFTAGSALLNIQNYMEDLYVRIEKEEVNHLESTNN